MICYIISKYPKLKVIKQEEQKSASNQYYIGLVQFMYRSKLILLLHLASFICMQTIAVSHAVEHEQHEHELSCDILLSIDNSPLTNSNCYQVQTCKTNQHTIFIELDFTQNSHCIRSYIRGPPAYF